VARLRPLQRACPPRQSVNTLGLLSASRTEPYRSGEGKSRSGSGSPSIRERGWMVEFHAQPARKPTLALRIANAINPVSHHAICCLP
jgi:hypothetical protein